MWGMQVEIIHKLLYFDWLVKFNISSYLKNTQAVFNNVWYNCTIDVNWQTRLNTIQLLVGNRHLHLSLVGTWVGVLLRPFMAPSEGNSCCQWSMALKKQTSLSGAKEMPVFFTVRWTEKLLFTSKRKRRFLFILVTCFLD